ncbi:MAG: flagellar hook-associated protein FlgK [Acidobacteria bacterium]|nr:flagellar hook-associated protein FlgK [Acidobacteriota bacterium]
MPSILSGFDSVQQALAAQQFALSISQRNVANANDPAYTRQVAVFSPDADGSVSGISGVTLQASRDRFLDYSISRELQTLGENSVAYDALQQIDAILGGNSGEGLQQALSDFFGTFSSLTTAPEDLVLRQQVLTSANALAAEFQRAYSGIQHVQTLQDRSMTALIQTVNSITAQIADLNQLIPLAHGTQSESEFTMRDSRQQLLEQLSGLMDISYYETESGEITVTTRQGGLLVAGDQSRDLSLTRLSPGAFYSVQLEGVDITATLESGRLGGLIKARDNSIAGYLDSLDDMAAAIIERVNDQHADGSDLNGSMGGDFFTPFTEIIPGSNTGCARSMSVAITDPRLIAAADAGAGVGDNTNAQLLAGIGDENLFSSSAETIYQYYARLIYQIGSAESAAEENISTQNNLLEQLKNQRDASFGVNLDEEAVNIIKYQKAYQASARYANILDALSDEILQLLGV